MHSRDAGNKVTIIYNPDLSGDVLFVDGDHGPTIGVPGQALIDLVNERPEHPESSDVPPESPMTSSDGVHWTDAKGRVFYASMFTGELVPGRRP